LEPHRTALFHRGNELVNDDASLAFYGVKADDTVHCRPLPGSSGSRKKGKLAAGSDDEDGASVGSGHAQGSNTLEDYFLYWGSERPAAAAEKGFANTLLNRRASPAAVAAADAPPSGGGGDGSHGEPMSIGVPSEGTAGGAGPKGSSRCVVTCAACTFENEPGAVTCSMCSQALDRPAVAKIVSL
jgi:hypothetical protein